MNCVRPISIYIPLHSAKMKIIDFTFAQSFVRHTIYNEYPLGVLLHQTGSSMRAISVCENAASLPSTSHDKITSAPPTHRPTQSALHFLERTSSVFYKTHSHKHTDSRFMWWKFTLKQSLASLVANLNSLMRTDFVGRGGGGVLYRIWLWIFCKFRATPHLLFVSVALCYALNYSFASESSDGCASR